jgi:uncharacterized membrane protein
MDRFWRRVVTGVLTAVPFLITVWVMSFVLDQVLRLGRPLVVGLAIAVRPYSDEAAHLLTAPWFQSGLAVAIVVTALYLIGSAANFVVGRRLLRLADRIMTNVPLARTIYGGTRSLVETFRTAPQAGGQRVVLIEFPNPEMRAIGFVTATFRASDTGEEVAAVYVPTTPNPTSGYVEIVPTVRLVWLDWSTSDAMSFIVSGGAVTPRAVPFRSSAASLRPAPRPAEDPTRSTAEGV